MIETVSARNIEPSPASGLGSARLRPVRIAWLNFLRQCRWVVGLLLVSAAWAASAADAPTVAESSSASDSKLRQMMERVQMRNRGAASSAGGTGYAQAIPRERLQERTRLMRTGEAALTRLELDKASNAFDRAALIQRAADTEIALVRAYMQGGQYRRALASGAHTAGAHLDVVAGSALYAWLLSAGGQGVIGRHLLNEAQARIPNHPIVTRVQMQWRSGAPVATGVLLAVPTRLAPYSSGPALPRRAQVAGSALLLADGRQALAPLALVAKDNATPMWVRNGMGLLTPATVVARLPDIGVALLKLEKSLPVAKASGVAANEAFPGSAGFAVEYTANSSAEAAWPLLHTGRIAQRAGRCTRPLAGGCDLRKRIENHAPVDHPALTAPSGKAMGERRTRRTLNALAIKMPCVSASPSSTPRY